MLAVRLFRKIVWGIFAPRPRSAPWKIVVLHSHTPCYSAPSPGVISPAWFEYEAELYGVIKRHCKGILQLLMLSSARGSMPDLSSQYDELHSVHLSIISGLAKLVLHLGGKEISSHNIKELTRNAEEEAIKLHTATIPTKCGSSGTASSAPDTGPPQRVEGNENGVMDHTSTNISRPLVMPNLL
jgi:hypothetical protein